MLVYFDGKYYNIDQQGKLGDAIKNFTPPSSQMCINNCIFKLYTNKIRFSPKDENRFDGHISSGIGVKKKSLSFFCKLDNDKQIIYIIVIGCHKYEKQKKNKKPIHSTTYQIFYQTPNDRNRYGKGNIQL